MYKYNKSYKKILYMNDFINFLLYNIDKYN